MMGACNLLCAGILFAVAATACIATTRSTSVLTLTSRHAASRQYARTVQHAPLGKRRIRSTRGSVVSA